MTREQKLINLCSKHRNWKVIDNHWCIQVKRGVEKYNTFNIPKYMLQEGEDIQILHENYRVRTSKKKGVRCPVHKQERIFTTIEELVNYIGNHSCDYERIIKKSRRR